MLVNKKIKQYSYLWGMTKFLWISNILLVRLCFLTSQIINKSQKKHDIETLESVDMCWYCDVPRKIWNYWHKSFVEGCPIFFDWIILLIEVSCQYVEPSKTFICIICVFVRDIKVSAKTSCSKDASDDDAVFCLWPLCRIALGLVISSAQFKQSLALSLFYSKLGNPGFPYCFVSEIHPWVYSPFLKAIRLSYSEGWNMCDKVL